MTTIRARLIGDQALISRREAADYRFFRLRSAKNRKPKITHNSMVPTMQTTVRPSRKKEASGAIKECDVNKKLLP